MKVLPSFYNRQESGKFHLCYDRSIQTINSKMVEEDVPDNSARKLIRFGNLLGVLGLSTHADPSYPPHSPCATGLRLTRCRLLDPALEKAAGFFLTSSCKSIRLRHDLGQ
jgi:hypothetical protein